MPAVNRGAHDLNLLTSFDALARERSVARAAQEIGFGQPATGHAHSRLRPMLGVGPFVRTPAGMMLTPRADEPILQLRQSLDDIRQAARVSRFDLGRTARGVALASDNRAATGLAEPLARRWLRPRRAA